MNKSSTINTAWDMGMDVTYKLLIENLGGYEKAKSKLRDNGSLHAERLKAALLEYRRQHNIYELDDYVVYQGDAGLSGLFRIEKLTKTGKPKSVKSNRFGGFPCRYCEVRHATDEEIKAGRRLP